MNALMPDGRTLSIAGNPHGVSGPWSYMILVETVSSAFRLQINPRGSVEMISVHTGRRPSLKIREASHNGQLIVSYEDTEQGGTHLAWLGDFHEVSTYVHGTDVSLDAFVRQLNLFSIVDSRDGMTVRARPGLGTSVTYAVASNFIPGVGGVNVKPIENVAASLPRGAGKKVAGGELWREDEYTPEGDLSRRTIFIANKSTYTMITPFVADDPALAPLAAALHVNVA